MSDLAKLLPPPLPKHLLIALRYDGVKEFPGLKNNPLLMDLLDLSDGLDDSHILLADDDDEAYCAKAMCAVYELAGIHSPRSARARDFLGWGADVDGPFVGCTCVLDRGHGMGHVTFPIGRTAEGHLVGFGFNQGNMAKASPFETSRILGYVYPKGLEQPKLRGFNTLPVLTLKDGAVSRNEA